MGTGGGKEILRFQCLNTACGRPFGWTAKKTIKDVDQETGKEVTYEYVVCPYCGSFDFDEESHISKLKQSVPTPPVQMPVPVKMEEEQFDPADLIEHKGWKNKKTTTGGYTEGSLSWGWDKENNFSPATIDVLRRGKEVIQGYEFSYIEQYHTVKVKKVKQ